MNIRVALVEDDPVVRDNLACLIDATPGFSCAARCATARQACAELPSIRPDVVLMDINLPDESGIRCVARLRDLAPTTQVIMLTVEGNPERVFDSLKAGATGYLVKSATADEILEAIRQIHSGGAPMSSHIARLVVQTFRPSPPPSVPPPVAGLSPRESEILRLVARGLRSKEIADELGIGLSTVNTHIRSIYEKLHVRSRAEAVARVL